MNKENQKLEQQIIALKNDLFSLQTVIALMPGYVFWKNKDGEYLGCNNNLAKFLGFSSPLEIIGKKTCDLMNMQLAWPLEKTDQHVFNSNHGISIEERGLNQNKEPAIFYSSKDPLRNINGDVIGIIGIAIDITERKRMEKELQIAKEKAEASSKAKSQFLAMINHELRTPLTGILGLINLLKESSEDQEKILNNLENCAVYLLRMINQVLDFSKLESGKNSIDFHSVKIEEPILSSIHILEGIAQKKNVPISYQSDLVPLVLSDGHVLQQIIMNLLSNALKFTAEGEIEVSVKLINESDEHVDLQIIVADTGIGIPANQLESIFEPFKQLAGTYTRKVSWHGTGLGLAIVKKLVELLNLTIHVESEIGKGTTFILQGQFAKSLENPQNLLKAKSISLRQKAPKVLLVEDDEIIRFTHQHMLESLGCKVKVAWNGLMALAMIDKCDIVFIDIGLPDMTGFDLIKMIRQQTSREELSIIAVTGYTGNNEKRLCLDAGANEVIIKPVPKERLKDVIRKYL
mgnify:CR=1 FL=1